jgi:hypothetical protein
MSPFFPEIIFVNLWNSHFSRFVEKRSFIPGFQKEMKWNGDYEAFVQYWHVSARWAGHILWGFPCHTLWWFSPVSSSNHCCHPQRLYLLLAAAHYLKCSVYCVSQRALCWLVSSFTIRATNDDYQIGCSHSAPQTFEQQYRHDGPSSS